MRPVMVTGCHRRVFREEWYRSQARLKHVAPRFGEVLVEGALVAWDVPT